MSRLPLQSTHNDHWWIYCNWQDFGKSSGSKVVPNNIFVWTSTITIILSKYFWFVVSTVGIARNIYFLKSLIGNYLRSLTISENLIFHFSFPKNKMKKNYFVFVIFFLVFYRFKLSCVVFSSLIVISVSSQI